MLNDDAMLLVSLTVLASPAGATVSVDDRTDELSV